MGFWDNVKDALATGGDREAFNARRNQRMPEDLLRRLRLGRVAIAIFNGNTTLERWSRYESGTNRSTGQAKTNYYEGYLKVPGNPHIHVVIDDDGRLQFIRDEWGNTIFDRSRGDVPPRGWD